MVAAEANNCSGGGRAAVAVAVKPVAQTAVVKAEAQSAASEVAAAAAAATGSRAAPAAGTACTATAAARAGHAGDAVCTACRRVYPIDVESYPVARLAGRGRRVRIGVRVRISNSRSENDEKISAGGKGVLSVCSANQQGPPHHARDLPRFSPPFAWQGNSGQCCWHGLLCWSH